MRQTFPLIQFDPKARVEIRFCTHETLSITHFIHHIHTLTFRHHFVSSSIGSCSCVDAIAFAAVSAEGISNNDNEGTAQSLIGFWKQMRSGFKFLARKLGALWRQDRLEASSAPRTFFRIDSHISPDVSLSLLELCVVSPRLGPNIMAMHSDKEQGEPKGCKRLRRSGASPRTPV